MRIYPPPRYLKRCLTTNKSQYIFSGPPILSISSLTYSAANVPPLGDTAAAGAPVGEEESGLALLAGDLVGAHDPLAGSWHCLAQYWTQEQQQGQEKGQEQGQGESTARGEVCPPRRHGAYWGPGGHRGRPPGTGSRNSTSSNSSTFL